MPNAGCDWCGRSGGAQTKSGSAGRTGSEQQRTKRRRSWQTRHAEPPLHAPLTIRSEEGTQRNAVQQTGVTNRRRHHMNCFSRRTVTGRSGRTHTTLDAAHKPNATHNDTHTQRNKQHTQRAKGSVEQTRRAATPHCTQCTVGVAAAVMDPSADAIQSDHERCGAVGREVDSNARGGAEGSDAECDA